MSVIALVTILASTVPSLYAFSSAAQILASAAPSLYALDNAAQTPTVVNASDRPAPPWMANLTDTQKATLEAKMKELKAANASRQEIHSAIDGLLKQWGIQIPERPAKPLAPPWMANLTDTQKATLKQKMEELKAAGKSPEEVRSVIADMLKEWGITVPQPPSDRPAPPWMANLTDTQKASLEQKIKEMKEAGKSSQEIRSALDEMLKQWGIQVPQRLGNPPAPPWMGNLTDTQKAILEAKIKELKAAGKTPQEIHSAIADMLKQWGIQVPQPRTPVPR